MNLDDYFRQYQNGNTLLRDYVTTTNQQEQSTQGLIRASQNARNAQIAHNEAIQASTLSAKAAAVATKALAIAGNMLIMWGVTKAVQLVSEAIDDYIHRVDNAREAIENANSDFGSAESSLESLSDEIATTSERLKELEELARSGDISVADEKELEDLRATNAELERKKRLAEENMRLAAKEAAKAADDALTVTTQSNYKTESSSFMTGYGSTTIQQKANVTPAEELKLAAEAAMNYAKQIDELNAAYTAGTISEEEYNSTLLDLQESETDARNRAAEMADIVYEAKDGYDNLTTSGEELNNNQKDLYASAEDAITAYDTYLAYINDVVDATSELADEQQDNSANFSDIFSLKDASDTLTDLGKINEEIDNFQTAYKGLKEAMDSYNKTGSFTLDQVQQIISYGGDYLKYLMDENGNLQLNEEALNKVAIARINEMRVKALSNLMDNLDQITNEENAQKYLETQLYKTATAYDTFTASRIRAWSANALENGISQGTIDEVTKSFKNQASAINEMFDNIDLRSIYSDSASAAKSASDTAKDYIESYMEFQKQSLESGKIDYQTYTNNVSTLLQDMFKKGKIAAKDYYDYTKQMLEVQKSIYDKVLSAVTRRYNKEIDKINDTIDGIKKQNEALEKQKDNYDSILSVVENVYQSRIDDLKEEQDAIQDNIDKLNDEADANQRLLDIENAKKALYESQTRRSILLYTEQDGYIYTQNEDEIKQNEQELADLQLEQTIDLLEKEKDALQESIDTLQEYVDKWNEIPDIREDQINRELAIALWGQDYEKVILSNRIEDIEAFKESYIEIQKQIDDNTSLIESYEEKITYYEQLKEQWESIADEYENSVEDQIAAMVIGRDWERDILDGRIDKLNDFKDEYNRIQREIAEAAWESANAQIEAAKEAEKGASGTPGGYKLSDDKVIRYSGAGVGYSSASMRPSFSLYAKGGVVSDKDKSFLDPMAKSVGEDHVVFVKNGERILTPAENTIWERFNISQDDVGDILRDLRNSFSSASFTSPKVFTPFTPKNQSVGNNFYGDVNITLPDVQDANSFARDIKLLWPNIVRQLGN